MSDPERRTTIHSTPDSSLDDHLFGLPSILEAALTSDKRRHVIRYLEGVLRIAAPERSPFHVSRDNVHSTHAFSDEELGRLSDEDIAEIGSRIEAHFRQDWYAEEVVFHAQALLDEKAKSATE